MDAMVRMERLAIADSMEVAQFMKRRRVSLVAKMLSICLFALVSIYPTTTFQIKEISNLAYFPNLDQLQRQPPHSWPAGADQAGLVT